MVGLRAIAAIRIRGRSGRGWTSVQIRGHSGRGWTSVQIRGHSGRGWTSVQIRGHSGRVRLLITAIQASIRVVTLLDLWVSFGRFLAPVTVSYSIYFSLWFLLLQFIRYSQILNLPCRSCTPLICCALPLKLCLGYHKLFFDALLALSIVFCR